MVSSNRRAELAGGIASALLTLPLSIGFGLFALSPLGERYAGYGVLAGLYSAIIVALVALSFAWSRFPPVRYSAR